MKLYGKKINSFVCVMSSLILGGSVFYFIRRSRNKPYPPIDEKRWALMRKNYEEKQKRIEIDNWVQEQIDKEKTLKNKDELLTNQEYTENNVVENEQCDTNNNENAVFSTSNI
jgi:hypothetical protein